MKYKYIQFVYVIPILFTCSVIGVYAKCTKISSCACETDDDKKIDLSQIWHEKSKYISSSLGNITFYFNACHDIHPVDLKEKNCSFTGGNLVTFNATDNTCSVIGSSANDKFALNDTYHNYQIVYTLEKSAAQVLLVCTEVYFDFLHAQSERSLLLFSPYACAKQLDNRWSTGAVFMMVIFVIAVLYFIGGSCTLYFLKGARGREMIPNADFWFGLPSLVKDGWDYLRNGCTVPHNPDAYDTI